MLRLLGMAGASVPCLDLYFTFVVLERCAQQDIFVVDGPSCAGAYAPARK